jgi:hypothetical protein
MDSKPVISKHKLLLEIILYNMNLQMNQLPVIVNRFIRNHSLVVEDVNEYIHQINLALKEEMIVIKSLSTDELIDAYLSETMIYSDSTSYHVITKQFIFVKIVFGKGIQRLHLLRSLLFDNHFGNDKNILSNGIVGIYVMLAIVMYQFFSDGNHRTALYLLELVLSTKGQRMCLLRSHLFPLVSYMEQSRCIPFLYQEDNEDVATLVKRLRANYQVFEHIIPKLPYIENFYLNYISHF